MNSISELDLCVHTPDETGTGEAIVCPARTSANAAKATVRANMVGIRESLK